MTDKVHPSAKPPPPPPVANLTIPAEQLNNNAGRRISYRPPQPPPRCRRGCCCSLCLWTTAALIVILFLAVVAGAVFYLVYQPHSPSFSVYSFHLSKFNLTDTAVITSSFNISLAANNTNRKITFIYDQATVRLFSGNVDVGNGSFSGFTQSKNVTIMSTVVGTSKTDPIDGSDVAVVKSSLRRKNLVLRMEMETKIRAQIGTVRTGKLEIRVTCNGIKIPIPSGKSASSAVTTSNVKCKLAPRFKIFRWVI